MIFRHLLVLMLVLCMFPAVGCRQAPKTLVYQVETPIGPISVKLNQKTVPKETQK